VSCGVWSRERCVRRKLVDVPLQYSSVTGWMGGEYGHATSSRSDRSPAAPQRNAAHTDETARRPVTTQTLRVRWGVATAVVGEGERGAAGVDGARDWAGRRGCEGTRGYHKRAATAARSL